MSILGIFLTILKIIGIILLSIIGCILLLMLVILFVAIKYDGEIETKGNLESTQVNLRISWFFKLVRLNYSLKNGKSELVTKILFKTLGGEKENSSEEREVFKEEEFKEPEKAEEKFEEEPKEPKKENQQITEPEEKPKERSPETSPPKKKRKKGYTFQKIYDKIESFGAKLEGLEEKKDKIFNFIQDKNHRAALGQVKEKGIILLKRLKPKYLKGNVCLGFEDPYHTGRVAAIYSVFSPWLYERITLYPNFEDRVLEGDLRIKGNVRVIALVCFLLPLVLKREVRTTYKDIRKFKL
ncbi:hypothetical protein M2454_000506 [Aequitasia blattaphilus]|uniref:DUF2953 domain-containing protein n=1 Tax=Aequitasia blattaphilus TaxID=2949332 RepID=A0ABT1E5I5_9FIRM|nr:DUF2953 domain-containing protein [Aequitasia blattaphilus]MCP1101105.1 DUF2953 domain-containing protein [Aequitasia blattaphilus]MCR8613745.1 DUF2953 domain-containing protein [Aequitasia blattaphilus]